MKNLNERSEDLSFFVPEEDVIDKPKRACLESVFVDALLDNFDRHNGN